MEKREKIVSLVTILDKVWDSIAYETDIINEVRRLLMEYGITTEADELQRIIEEFNKTLKGLFDIIEDIKNKI